MILTNILSFVGNFGPFILFIFSLYLLRKTPNALYYYLIGFLLNMILNIILKLTFKQPRPKDDEDLFKLTLNYASKYNCVLPFDIYGMPSGHAESVIFSTIFIHLMFNNSRLTLIFYT
jgi:membrane-associated phospholipid phosphatase